MVKEYEITKMRFLVVAFSGLLCANVVAQQPGIREAFKNPPEDTRLQLVYHWLSDCVTREGLSRDFKAMGEIGVGVAHIVVPVAGQLPTTARMMSPEWLDLFTFAIEEARKNGIKLSFHNCPGWSSSGGPWINPEDSMKIVVFSETDIGPCGTTRIKLPQPKTNCGFFRDIAVYALALREPAFKALKVPVNVPVKGDGSSFVVDACSGTPIRPTRMVLTIANDKFHVDGMVEASADGRDWSRVGEFKIRSFRTPAVPRVVELKPIEEPVRHFRVRFTHAPPLPWVPSCDLDLRQVEFVNLPIIGGVENFNSATSKYGYHPELASGGAGLDEREVVDLTPFMAADGSVDFSSEDVRSRLDGHWGESDLRVLRIGYTAKGIGPSSTIGGLECDKLDRKGINAHWKGMPAKILNLPGARGTVVSTYIDSYEVGGQNWSENLADEFARRRGYSIDKNLMTVCGYAMGDFGKSAKFLWDFQKTIGELYCANYYGRFAELCHENGLVASAQTYGGPFDWIAAAERMDEPQAEFWLDSDGYRVTARMMASAAHLTGRRIVSAESFTTDREGGRWLATPRVFRKVGDRFGWLEGVNRFVLHSYCHQPFTNAVPGLSLGRHGSQFNVNTTWWKEARHWHDYVRRGQALLQYGSPRAEVLVLGRNLDEKLFAAGYNYDFCSVYDLPSLQPSDDGIRSPGGVEYALLCITPETASRLSPSMRSELKRLEDAGAPVVVGSSLEAVRKIGLQAPFVESTGALRAIRRVAANGETIWFVVNTGDVRFVGNAVFLAGAGARPEIFDAITGEIAAVECHEEGGGRYRVALDLEANGSAFVVFSKDVQPYVRQKIRTVHELDISKDWRIVAFEGRNAPAAPLKLAELYPWNESGDDKAKYFSGRAIYTKMVDMSSIANGMKANEELVLDLGDVHELANVSVNGVFLACLWDSPYRVRLPWTLLKSSSLSEVELDIEVVNNWPNRMIGDAIARRNGASEPSAGSCRLPKWVLENCSDSGTGIFTWTNYRQAWSADDALLRSGLTGPVVIRRSAYGH